MRFFYFLSALILFPSFTFAQDIGSVDGVYESRGLVRSVEKVKISTDLVARVDSASFHDGMGFDRGDILVSFDCARYRAELSSSEALASGAMIDLRSKEELYLHNAVGKSELDIAATSVSRANSDVELRKALMTDCEIVAPFDGRVVSLFVRRHEMPVSGEPIITILDASRLELELVVPSHWLTWLASGKEFFFHVDETGKRYVAIIDRLGAEVDPVSQTVKAFGILQDQHNDVLAGMSGAALFNIKEN